MTQIDYEGLQSDPRQRVFATSRVKGNPRVKVMAHKPPSHLVLLKRGRVAHAFAAEAFGAQEVGPTVQGLASTLSTDDGRELSLYNRLGIAAVDLGAEEAERLEQSEDVEAIVVNEVRTLPTPVVMPTDAQVASAQASAWYGAGPASLVGYLRGMRDATDALLRLLGESVPVERLPLQTIPALSNGQEISWCLGMVGLQPGYPGTGRGVTVAVLDTGVDLNHLDLRHHFTSPGKTETFVAGEGVQDLHGHGTHCAGVIAGAIRPASGPRYSVAPGAELLVGKVLSNAGRGYDDNIIAGIEWASEHGASIISMSLGSRRSQGEPFSPLYERLGQSLLEEGVVLIAASGNDSARPAALAPVGNPAACPSFLAVAAVDQATRVAPFSNAGVDFAQVDLAAPGVSVLSSYTGGGYRLLSGTSMATPHVAGVAALWAEAKGHRGQALWDALVTAAVASGNVVDLGRGIVRVP